MFKNKSGMYLFSMCNKKWWRVIEDALVFFAAISTFLLVAKASDTIIGKLV